MALSTPNGNLVSEIPEEKQKEIVAAIIADYDSDILSRAGWEAKRSKWYRLWACDLDKKNDPWPGASNVCIPMLSAASNQFHARSYQSIFAAPGMVKTVPVGKNDIKRAKNVETFLNWQTLYEMQEYEEVFDKLLQLLPINGLHFKKLWWDVKGEKPQTEHISASDIVLPYRTRTLETSRRIVHRLWLYYDEMLDRHHDDLYDTENFNKIPKGEQGQHDQNETKLQGDKLAGETPNLSEAPRLVLECHKKFDLGDGRKPYIFTVDRQAEVLLRATSRIYKRGAHELEINNFVDYHFLPNPEGFNSFGFGHFLEPLNQMANTAFNQIFDAGRLSNQPFGFYGRRAGIKRRKIKLHPGSMEEVEDASQVFFPNLQRVDQVLFMILGLIQQYTEQFTSTSDYLSGRESKGTKTPTAHGTLAIIEQGLVTFAVMTKRIFRCMRKELRLMMALNQIFLPDTKEYRIMGDEDAIAFPDIKAEDFESVYDVIPIGDPSYASRATLRQEAMELYQVLMGNPLIIGNPQLGLPPNKEAMHEALSDVIDTYDKKNKSKLLPELPESSRLSPDIENAMMMQGEDVKPKPGENHQGHIKVHTNFRKTPYFKSMVKEYQKMVDDHIVETTQFAYIEQQEKQRLGAGGQQQQPGPQQGQPPQQQPGQQGQPPRG